MASFWKTVGKVDSVNDETGAITLTKSWVGLANVDNTSDASKPVSTAAQTALNAKENSITAGTTAQYWRGDKSFQTLDKAAVGLSNVDNTSDANKPLSTAATNAMVGVVKAKILSHTFVEEVETNDQIPLGTLPAGSRPVKVEHFHLGLASSDVDFKLGHSAAGGVAEDLDAFFADTGYAFTDPATVKVMEAPAAAFCTLFAPALPIVYTALGNSTAATGTTVKTLIYYVQE